MIKDHFNGPPSPEEFQRQLTEFMRQHFHEASGGTASKPDFDVSAGSDGPEAAGSEFKFDYKPRDVKAYLDRFVIKQEEAKKVLSVALVRSLSPGAAGI